MSIGVIQDKSQMELSRHLTYAILKSFEPSSPPLYNSHTYNRYHHLSCLYFIINVTIPFPSTLTGLLISTLDTIINNILLASSFFLTITKTFHHYSL